MTDHDHWKKKYQSLWGQSSKRETEIAIQLCEATGKEIKPVGLGAGSTQFLTGPASQHGHTKGDADLHVVGTNIYLEVTGPLTRSVTEDKPLWIRPDKIQNARLNNSHETWVVHHLPKTGLVRVVPLGVEFWKALDAGAFRIVTPCINQEREHYYEIPASHPCVKLYGTLVARLEKA